MAFQCFECGGVVEPAIGADRMFLYRKDVELPIPKDFVIPTCSGCGERYLSSEVLDQLTDLLEVEYRRVLGERCKELISRLKNQHNTTQRDIERACGVTPSYLSHVVCGRKAPGVTLVRLLETLTVCPSEFQRHLHGLPLADARLMLGIVPGHTGHWLDTGTTKKTANPTHWAASSSPDVGNGAPEVAA